MCCGKNRIAASQSVSPSRIGHPGAAIRVYQGNHVAYFEYRGATALTAIGSATGMRYRFAAPGSRVAVDLRDRRSLAAIPQLAQVQSL
jgi:hypothetical protein